MTVDSYDHLMGEEQRQEPLHTENTRMAGSLSTIGGAANDNTPLGPGGGVGLDRAGNLFNPVVDKQISDSWNKMVRDSKKPHLKIVD